MTLPEEQQAAPGCLAPNNNKSNRNNQDEKTADSHPPPSNVKPPRKNASAQLASTNRVESTRAVSSESPVERAKRFLTSREQTSGGDLKLEFEDDARSIFTSQHYMCFLSPVFESVLQTTAPAVEATDHITQRGSRKKHQHIQKTSVSGDDKCKSYKLQGNSFENVLDFLTVCYVNDDTKMTVDSENLISMLELADEWNVACMIQKCENVLKSWVDEVRSTAAWEAVCRGDGRCGCPEKTRRLLTECIACNAHKALSKLSDAAQLATKHNLKPIWSMVLDMMQSMPLKQASDLLHVHEAFAPVSFKDKYFMLVHCIAMLPSPP